MKDSLRSKLLIIVGGYVVISALWIAFSDLLVVRISNDPGVVQVLNTSKGWLFVVTTALLLYGVLRRRDHAIEERQASLRAGAEHLKAIYDTVNEAIFVHDAQTGRILDCNQRACEIYGYSHQQLISMSIGELSEKGSMYTQARALEWMDKAVHQGSQVFEWRARRSDGTCFWTEVSLGSSSTGGQRYLVAAVRDITTKQAMEEVLHRAQRLEALGVLAGGIAHDFNNLLAGIFGHIELAQLALRELDVQEAKQNVTEALAVSDRARALTQQLLTFAKGGAPLRKVQAVSDLVRKAVTFATTGSNCEVSFISENTEWLCSLDENQIGQVIDNLVINAKHAMPHGGRIEVVVENRPASAVPGHLPARDHVHISIRDHGVGIPREHLQRIFDPFFTTKDQGSGLGLATSHSIVGKHDGHIEVDSEVGAGSVFHLWLPRARGRSTSAEEPSSEGSRGQGQVLVMDDEDSVLAVASSMLRHCGYEATSAKNVEQAVELAKIALAAGRPFRAAILDITIPGGPGGKEAVGRLKALDPTIRVLASSGYSSDDVLARPQELGFDGSLPKPYQLRDLRLAVSQLLSSDPAEMATSTES
jgi:PAS domain S-box-containing protein